MGDRLWVNGFVMEVNTLSIIIYVLVPILTAVLGGWIGKEMLKPAKNPSGCGKKCIFANWIY